MSDKMEIEGVEAYRTCQLSFHEANFRLVARVIAVCGHIPVVQMEKADTVLYAVRPGLIRKAKKALRKRSTTEAS